MKWRDGTHSSNLGSGTWVVIGRLLRSRQSVGCRGPGGLRTEFHLKVLRLQRLPLPQLGCWDSVHAGQVPSHVLFNKLILWPKFLVNACNSHLLAFIMLSTALRFHKHQSILAHVDFLCICIYINKALVVIIMSNIFYLL